MLITYKSAFGQVSQVAMPLGSALNPSANLSVEHEVLRFPKSFATDHTQQRREEQNFDNQEHVFTPLYTNQLSMNMISGQVKTTI